MTEINFPFEFLGFRLEENEGALKIRLHGQTLKLSEKATLVLDALILAKGEITSTRQLLNNFTLSKEAIADDAAKDQEQRRADTIAAVKEVVGEVRLAIQKCLCKLGHDPETQIIEYVPKAGYRLSAENLRRLMIAAA